MAGFKLSRPFSMSRDAVRDAAQGLAEQLTHEHGLDCRWRGDCVHLSGKGVNGKMDFSGDTIDVDVKLGLLASAFQGLLKREVNRYLDEYVS